MIEEMLTYYLPAYLHNKYLFAAIIFLVFFAISKLFTYLVEKVVLVLTAKTKTKLDDELAARTRGPVSWLLIFIGFKIALEYLHIENGVAHFFDLTTTSLIYLGVGIVLTSVVSVLITHWGHRIAKKTKSSVDDALMPLFRKSMKVVILVLVAIMILDIWGVNVTGLLAGVGIAGIAIGFAVKDSLANIFGGVSLILDKSVNVGDKLQLSDGTLGVVEEVGIRATAIKTYDNELVIVPNGTMSTMTLKNFNRPDRKQRVTVLFGVEYGEDPDKVKKLVLAEITKMKEVLRDPEPSVRFSEMADFALNMKVFFWVDDISKAFDAKEEATIRIYKLLKKHRIGIPFPTQTVHVKK
ncbi:mechanosensitive ion channel family protein [Candidatus Woesearchaeota archaeon]|nr:mechanosensitive ion channel family protein [Candidatus Woesearchaeota archaeon]